MRKSFWVMPAIASLIVSCSQPSTDAPAQDYDTVATIKDIMDSLVDPSADFIWDSVGAVITAEGVTEKAPANDEEWQEERRHAIRLIESANLMVMPGRRVAAPGDEAENPEIELSPEQIEAEIASTRRTFLRLANEFQTTAIEILQAADNRDLDALLRLGAELDVRCENCHKTYWYPNDPVFKNEPKETDKDKAPE